MDYILPVMAFGWALTLCGVYFLLQQNVKFRAKINQLSIDVKKASNEPTFDCRELLHDLTEGAALVKITRISPMDIYVRRS